MFETVLYGLVILLALVGLVDLIHGITMRILAPREDGGQIMLIPLKDENAEITLRYAAEKAKMMGKRCKTLLAVDFGLSQETAEICRRFCEEQGSIILCGKDNMLRVLERIK